MNKNVILGVLAAVAFLACIVLANYFTITYGLIPVGFGLVATAGTYFAGLTFVMRDSVQDALGIPATIALIIVGAAISLALGNPIIAIASGVAFLASELADLTVYTPLRKRGYVRAAVASNIVGTIADTLLFLWIAGFPITWLVFAGQMVAKTTVTVIVVAAVAGFRAVSRGREFSTS